MVSSIALPVLPQGVDVEVRCGVPAENNAILTLGKDGRGEDVDVLATLASRDFHGNSYDGVSPYFHNYCRLLTDEVNAKQCSGFQKYST